MMHVVIVVGEGKVTQADRLAGEYFSSGTSSPRLLALRVDCGKDGQQEKKGVATKAHNAPLLCTFR